MLNLNKLAVFLLILAVFSHLSIADLGSSTQAIEEVLITLSTTTSTLVVVNSTTVAETTTTLVETTIESTTTTTLESTTTTVEPHITIELTTTTLEPTTTTIGQTTTIEPTTTTLGPTTTIQSTTTTLELTTTTEPTSTTIEQTTTTLAELTTTSVTTTTVKPTTTTTLLAYSKGDKLDKSYKLSTGFYDAIFKPSGEDYALEFNAYDSYLRLKPIGIETRSRFHEPKYDLRYVDEDEVEYRGAFDGKGTVAYDSDRRKLKETIIFQDLTDMPGVSLSTSTMSTDVVLIASSTMSIQYELIYPSHVDWEQDGGDIRFIRKREPHKLYLINDYFTIKEPYAQGNSGKRIDLTYSFNGSFLSLNVPAEVAKLDYPIEIDPTIEWEDNDGISVDWENWKNCSSNTNSCNPDIDDNPSEIHFSVDSGCSSGNTYEHPVQKGLFQFDITPLEAYGGDLDWAKVWSRGDCNLENKMPSGYAISIYHIDEFDESPTCAQNPDDQNPTYKREMMTPTSCPGSSSASFYVTTELDDALFSDDYLAFKLDISPELEYDDDPESTYFLELYESQLELEYSFTCSDSDDCPSTEYCEYYGETCELDLDYGDDCEDAAVDNDSLACEGNNCQYDDFDGSGYFCSLNNRCIHNDNDDFTTGDIHCADDDSYWKNCTGTTWSSSTACSYGCTEGVGCDTTTTTTTTTLPPSIQTNPTEIVIRRYVE